MTRRLARRAFFTGAAAMAGIAMVEAVWAGERRDGRPAYFLDPEWGAGDSCPDPHAGSRGCHACRACHSHAENKLFRTAALADAARAHRHCKCLVTSEDVPSELYFAIFGPPRGPLSRDEFDRRRDKLFTGRPVSI